jgi:hypothetical protein
MSRDSADGQRDRQRRKAYGCHDEECRCPIGAVQPAGSNGQHSRGRPNAKRAVHGLSGGGEVWRDVFGQETHARRMQQRECYQCAMGVGGGEPHGCGRSAKVARTRQAQLERDIV